MTRLASERLDDTHAGDVLGERRGDKRRSARARGGTRGSTRIRNHAVASDDQRQDRQRREREPPVEDQDEHDRGADEEQGVLDEAGDAVGDELVERFDVVRDPADDRAGAVALEEAEREPLQVREQLVAQVGEDALPDPARLVGLGRRQHERRDAGSEERDDDQRQRVQVLLPDPLVDGELREVRRNAVRRP